MAEKKTKIHKINLRLDKNQDEKRETAKLGLSPEFSAMAAIISLDDSYAINCLLDELVEQKQAVTSGDMKRAEAMLISQATTLEKLFTAMMRKALIQSHMPNYEGFMRLALKSQNQCRMTLETLSNIKNPPVVYAKQANIVHGPQQINNAPSRAAENQKQQNELLEVQHGERMDTGTASETIGGNQAMATLE
ncbi:MAG: hypothetical protein PHH11_07055 [Methylomonas sp.]|nr:hypothetical protein [Methylomonas sp.]